MWNCFACSSWQLFHTRSFRFWAVRFQLLFESVIGWPNGEEDSALRSKKHFHARKPIPYQGFLGGNATWFSWMIIFLVLRGTFEIPYSNLNSFQIFTPLRGRGRPHRDQRFSRLSFSQSHVLLGVPKPHILQHFCTAINKKHWYLPWSLGSNAQGIYNGYTTKKRDATLVRLAGLTLASNTVDSPSSFLMLIRAYCCRKICYVMLFLLARR